MTVFNARQFFDGQQVRDDIHFVVEDGRIVKVGTGKVSDAIELDGLVAPGYVDVHVNGGGGALLNNQPDLEAVKTMMSAHAQFGTTTMLPTLITDSLEVMEQSAEAVALAIQEKVPGIRGIHFEGPHLSNPKRGVHREVWIRDISEKEIAVFARNDLGKKIVTLAPENVTPEQVKSLVEEHQVIVSIGHSNANYETAMAAVEAGATGFTHLFNAMSPMQSRAPGVVGAALDDQTGWCGIILDGHHMDAATARIALRAKPKGKMVLVTDAMSPVGTNENLFPFFDTEIIRTGDRLNAPTGELAGSVLDMAGAVKNAVEMLEVDVEEAIRMASLYPAEFVGLADEIGTLEEGKCADFIVLDDSLNVQSTWQAGVCAFSQSSVNG